MKKSIACAFLLLAWLPQTSGEPEDVASPEQIRVFESSFRLDPPNPDGSFPDRVSSRNIRVRGVYSGQLTRDLTPAILGTTYTSSDTRIVTVTEDGVLQPVAPGLAYIIVENQDLREFVEVIVEDPTRDSPPAVDKTNDVDIRLGKLMWRAADDGLILKQQVTITNKTSLPLSWLSLVLDGLPENVRLIDDDGETETLPPLGNPYYDVLPWGKSFLLPGESVSITAKFTPVADLPITYNLRVVSGSRP